MHLDILVFENETECDNNRDDIVYILLGLLMVLVFRIKWTIVMSPGFTMYFI